MDIVQAEFDYAVLGTEDRDALQSIAAEIKAAVRQTAFYTGQKLIDAKKRLEHGQFLGWLKLEFDWSERTARNLMQVAETFESAKFADLDFSDSALYLLASPSTPEPARLEAIERAETGEKITYSAARDIVAFHKDTHAMCPECGTVYSTSYLSCPECTYKHGGALRVLDDSTGEIRSYPHPDVHAAESKPHVAYNSGNNEWYTPPEYIRAARHVLGDIDLDPASSEQANKTVGAATFFTAEDDGLRYLWEGRVWMNPPYSSDLIGKFCAKFVQHVEDGDIQEAIVLVNNATDTTWFQRLLGACSAVCFTRGRVRFIDKAGNPSGAPLQGQALLYFGSDADAFVSEFARFGGACRWTTNAE